MPLTIFKLFVARWKWETKRTWFKLGQFWNSSTIKSFCWMGHQNFHESLLNKKCTFIGYCVNGSELYLWLINKIVIQMVGLLTI